MAAVNDETMSTAMQAALTALSGYATQDPAKEVTIKEMCDAVCTAIANEVNASIYAEYLTHIHTTTTAPANGITTVPQQPAPPPP